MLAHELSHVAHKDVQVMTVASLLGDRGRAAGPVRVLLRALRRRHGGNNNQNALPIIALIMVVSVVVYAISFLLIRMLSRYRELAADRSGALLTGQPSALASALTKVSDGMSRIPNEDLRKAEPMNAFYFAPAMKLHGGGGGKPGRSLFSTHPSLEKRIEQLAKIQAQLNDVSPGAKGLK